MRLMMYILIYIYIHHTYTSRPRKWRLAYYCILYSMVDRYPIIGLTSDTMTDLKTFIFFKILNCLKNLTAEKII